MKKQSRELLVIVVLFTIVSLWSNHAHLAYAVTHGTWWYLTFYAYTYVMSLAVIGILAFVLTKIGKAKKRSEG